MATGSNGWDKYQLMVLDKLENLERDMRTLADGNSEDHRAIHDSVTEIKTEFAVHKVKSGFIGLLGGALATGTAIGVAYLKGMFGWRG